MQKISKKIAELKKQINRANDLYFNQDKPEISDAKYDKLLAKLISLEEKYPELKTADSPTQKIGAKTSPSFATIKHSVPMLSLEKAHDLKKVDLFLKRCEAETKTHKCLLTPKLDGIAISLIYENGKLVNGVTRGDGVKGEDITENLLHVKGIHKTLSSKKAPAHVLIRGEVVMPHKAFIAANKLQVQEGNQEFVNPRNAAAGILRQKNPDLVANKNLVFIAYWAILGDEQPQTSLDVYKQLQKWKFNVSEPFDIKENLADCEKYLKQIEDNRANFEYDIDGVVIRLDNVQAQETMGRTAKAPRALIAYKFTAEKVITTLVEVENQLGRTGVITPVAVLNPIKVGGATVTKATLHNYKFINSLDLKLGDKVTLIRSGDVIPKIDKYKDLKRTGEEKPIKVPKKCPDCNSAIIDDDVNIFCTGNNCIGTKIAVFRHFVSRSVMDIDGIGDKLGEALLKNNLVNNPADIFKLTKEDIFKLERKKDKSVNNIINAITQAKKTSLDRVLSSLGIHGLGKTGAEVIASSPNPMKLLANASPEVISFLETINFKTAKHLQMFFNQENKDDLNLENLEIPKYIPVNQLEILKEYGVKWTTSTPQKITASIADLLSHINYLIKAKEEDKKLISLSFIDYIKNNYPDLKNIKDLAKLDYQINNAKTSNKQQERQSKNFTETAKRIVSDKDNIKLFTELNKYLKINWGVEEAATGVFANKLVLVTGTIEGHTRKSAQELVINNGGKIASAISSKTDLVVVGENAGKSKLAKIEKLNIERMEASEFLKILDTK